MNLSFLFLYFDFYVFQILLYFDSRLFFEGCIGKVKLQVDSNYLFYASQPSDWSNKPVSKLAVFPSILAINLSRNRAVITVKIKMFTQKLFHLSIAELRFLRKYKFKLSPTYHDGSPIINDLEYTPEYSKSVKIALNYLEDEISKINIAAFAHSINEYFNKCSRMEQFYARLRYLFNLLLKSYQSKDELIIKCFALTFEARDHLYLRGHASDLAKNRKK